MLYRKKLKPLVISKAQERFQKKGLKYAPSSEGRSTSPESPFKLPLPHCSQPQSPLGAAAASFSGNATSNSISVSGGTFTGSAAPTAATMTSASMQYRQRPQQPQVRINPLHSSYFQQGDVNNDLSSSQSPPGSPLLGSPPGSTLATSGSGLGGQTLRTTQPSSSSLNTTALSVTRSRGRCRLMHVLLAVF